VNDHTRQLEELPIVPVSDPPAPNGHQPRDPYDPVDPYDDRRGRLVVVGLVFALLFLLIAAVVWWATDPDGAPGDALVPEAAPAPKPAPEVAATASSAPSSAPPAASLSAYALPAEQEVAPTSEPAAPVAPPPPASAEPTAPLAPESTVPPTSQLPTTVAAATPTSTLTVASTLPQTTVATSPTPVPTTTSAPAPPATTTTVAAAPSTTVAAETTTVASAAVTLLNVIASRPELSRMQELVDLAQLHDELSEAAPRTLFAPSNAAIDAFAATPEGGAVLADPESLRQLLLRHLVAEARDADAIFSTDRLESMSGDTLTVDQSTHTVDGADLLVVDLGADTGFVHIVSQVFAGAEATDGG